MRILLYIILGILYVVTGVKTVASVTRQMAEGRREWHWWVLWILLLLFYLPVVVGVFLVVIGIILARKAGWL